MIINDEYKLAYLPCPKNACTSLKKYFYYLHFKVVAEGEDLNNIHEIFKTRFKETKAVTSKHLSLVSEENLQKLNSDGYYIFFILRDPVERFISGFRNRVLQHNDLYHTKNFEQLCNNDKSIMWPSIDTFVENFDFYFFNFPKINHHFRLQADICSKEFIPYLRIFNMSKNDEIKNLYGELHKITNIKIEDHDQKSKAYQIEKNQKIIDFVNDFYSHDYKIFNNFL